GGNLDGELRINYYTDVGYETDTGDSKSQARYIFVLNGGAIDGKSAKQSTTAMYSTEVVCIAAS
nr:hypothetical protein [Tanacetum cinerariifolium]